jgi:flagellar basal body P-ring formation protein FlgA
MKHFLALVWFFLLFGLTSMVFATGYAILIRLPEKATVVGPKISLGEVAEVIGDEKVMLERLRRLDLGRAAEAGRTIKLTQAFIKIALRRGGYSLQKIGLDGPELVDVLTKSQEISTSDLLAAAKSFVVKALNEDSGNVSVKLSGIEKKLFLPAGHWKTNFRPPLSGKYEGTLLMTVELEADGRLVRVLPLRLVVEVMHPVVVTTRLVEKGDKFTADNVSLVKRPTTQVPQGAFHHLDDVLGRTASTLLSPGTAIRMSYLHDPPLVKRGQMVEAIVEQGNVEISVHVRAVEDGKLGDVIRVENSESHKVLRGKILNDKTILVGAVNP